MSDLRRFDFRARWTSIYRYLRNPKTDWKPKALLVLALLYLLWPLDLIPDIAPLIGWLDDLGFATLAVAYLAHAARE